MKFRPINPSARKAVYARSGGICERCDEFEAVHVHHLTYERAGCELPEDLEHVCIGCHCAAHPKKALQILEWEIRRLYRIANTTGEAELESEDERREMEEDEEDLRMREYESQQEKKREQERVQPAWNLGRYHASGYSIEDVEEEERYR